MEYVVKMVWDNDAGVWTATSDDIPGLVLEFRDFDALVYRVCRAVPELLAPKHKGESISLSFLSERRERIVV